MVRSTSHAVVSLLVSGLIALAPSAGSGAPKAHAARGHAGGVRGPHSVRAFPVAKRRKSPAHRAAHLFARIARTADVSEFT
jgi:hypothetical protein